MYHRIGPAAYKTDRDNILILLEKLGNPHLKFKSIHIAGTNGKGSVSHLLASVLHEAKLKTALFTSPHLKDFRERIKINGKKIPKSNVKKFIKTNTTIFQKLKPSFFEMTVALAFNYFAEQNVDIAVVEAGLGGRLDSTNVITPELSVITNISYDHQHLLGNTLQKIAIEKAGIIKDYIPAIIGETNKDTKHIFEEKAKNAHTQLLFADNVFKIKNYSNNFLRFNFAHFEIDEINSDRTFNLDCPLLGLYQKKNVVTALCALKKLIALGYNINTFNIENGFKNVLKNTKLMGRWQIIKRKPLTICDTAHNVAGINEVTQQLRTISYNKLHIVFGCVEDKDLKEVLALLPRNAKYYFCKPNIPRGLDELTLLKAAHKVKLKGNAYVSVAEAFQSCLNNANTDDLIFIGGSTFVVAEIV